MKHIEGTFKSIRDNNLYYQGWLPDGTVKAVLFITHGLGEHGGRYMNYVNRFVPLGYAIYIMDLLGHGKSDGEREVVVSFQDYLAPLKEFYGMVKGWQPQVPIFLLGHSMGGELACCYLLANQNDFKGAIISAPAIVPGESITAITIAMAKLLSVIAPKAGLVVLDHTKISRDPQVVKDYFEDPLVFHGKTSARLGAEMLKGIELIMANMAIISLPLFIFQGSADNLINTTGAHLLIERTSSTNKTLKVYEGLFHEVHNEPEREVMFKDLEAWLKAHI